jgi:hypothetical protein
MQTTDQHALGDVGNAAAEFGRPHGTGCSFPLIKSAYANAAADAVGTRLWMKVPGRLGLLLGHRLTSLTRSVRASNRRFVEATGWHPRYPSARGGYLATSAR